MTTEPSDILKLLKMLGDEQGDHTCRSLYDYATHKGMPILEVCHAAILSLATEKKGVRDRLTEMVAMMQPKPMVISAEDRARLGIQLPPKSPPA